MIPEAAVEAAAKCFAPKWDAGLEEWRAFAKIAPQVRTALEAAAPYFYASCGRADYGQHDDDQLTATEPAK